jgi:hypothetical protein
MAQRYYNVAETAEIFGVSEDDVKEMLGRQELHGYRDGADWKFKAEDIDRMAQQRREQQADEPSAEGSDVLLSEVELGESDPGASGTVIGLERDGKPAADSDIHLGDDFALAGQDEVGSKISEFEELDLSLEQDLTLQDSQQQSKPAAESGSSDIDLAGNEDDDLVLGGSGAGSDITIGGDSGISLVDPTDSGLSLEEPLELSGSGAESLELGEDDMLSLGEDADTETPTELKTDDDFLLTPLEDVEDDDSESGSQVIALDTEGEGDEVGATVAAGAAGGMAAMLDEDLSAEPVDQMGIDAALGDTIGTAPLSDQPGALTEGAPVAAAVALPEMPYSVWNLLGLGLCTFLLIFCGMFMYDLLRNMWSWSTPYTVNSSIMDTILGWFGG